MARYIDADELLEELENKIKRDNENRKVTIDHDFITLVDDAPTADVEEVVRCKDCLYFEHQVGSYGICNHWHTNNQDICDLNFCSYGERNDT